METEKLTKLEILILKALNEHHTKHLDNSAIYGYLRFAYYRDEVAAAISVLQNQPKRLIRPEDRACDDLQSYAITRDGQFYLLELRKQRAKTLFWVVATAAGVLGSIAAIVSVI